jgi:TIR domain
VFICYSHLTNSAYVESLAIYLTDAGVPVWFDKEIITGDRWEHMIRNQIDTCAGKHSRGC